MLVLRHVMDDEAQRIILGGLHRRLEPNGFVLHTLHATLVFGLRFGQEICLVSPRIAWPAPAEIGGVDVNREEEIATTLVGNGPTIIQTDERIRRARHHDLYSLTAQRLRDLVRDGEGNVLLADLLTAPDRAGHSVVRATMPGIDHHTTLRARA